MTNGTTMTMDDGVVEFTDILHSQDGGQLVVEMVVNARQIIDLVRNGRLVIGNIRPDHDRIYRSDGTFHKFAKSPKRLEDWEEDLHSNTATFGNLTWNINPNHCEYELTDNALRLLSGKISLPDSAMRMRSIWDAGNREACTMNMDTKFSIRVWFVKSTTAGDDVAPGELTEEAVFDFYQNYGKPVDQSVARYNYRRDPLEQMIFEFVTRSEHLAGPHGPGSGLDNVEVKKNSVSGNSAKLAAYNTFVQAFKDSWSQNTSEDEVQWLLAFWDALVQRRPELGIVSKEERQNYRDRLLTSLGLGIHGLIGLAAHMHRENLPFTTLDVLNVPVTLDDETEIDYFARENPVFLSTGIVVCTPSKDGGKTLSSRNSRRSRREIIKLILTKVGL